MSNSSFSIERTYETLIKRFSMRGRKINFKINPVPNNTNPIEWIKSAITSIVQYALSGLEPTDKVGITFCGQSFLERGPAWLSYRDASDVKVTDIWEIISKIFQSNSEGKFKIITNYI